MISPRQWAGLAVLMLPVLLVSIDVTALYFAVPFISRDLHPTATEQLWVLDAYGFVLAGLLVTMGALGDRLGRRRLLIAGAALFGGASVAGAFAPNVEVLIAARALMGVGGATLMPTTLALIRELFPEEGARKTAIGLWTAMGSGGAALGPIVGGVLLEHFWWGSVLLINVPVMAALLAFAPRLVPEARGRAHSPVDFASAALTLGAILPLVWGVKQAAVDGVAPVHVVAVIAGLLVGMAFVRRQRTLADPMIDLGLFSARVFRAATIVNLVSLFALVGFAAFITQYLQLVLGLSPLSAALWSLPAPLSVGVAAPVALAAARRWSEATVVSAGLMLGAVGFAVMAAVPADDGLATLVAGSTLLTAGIAATLTLITDMVVTAAPADRTGTAAALTETGSELGGALGVAVLGSIGAAVYHARMGVAPSSARDTLGGAVDTPWMEHAHHAFAAGLHVAAAAGLVVVLAAVVVAVRGLRDRPASSPEMLTLHPAATAGGGA